MKRKLLMFVLCILALLASAVSVGALELIYHANGGTDAPAPQSITPGQPFYLSTQTPVRDNAEFLGWTNYMCALKSPENSAFAPGAEFNVNPSIDFDVPVFAAWRFNTAEDIVITGDTVRNCWGNINFTWQENTNVGIATEISDGWYDPQIVHTCMLLEAENYKYVVVDMMVETEAPSGALEFYFAAPEEAPSAEKCISVPHSGSTGGEYQPFVMDLTQNSLWTGTIGTLRFDPFNGASGKFEIKSIRFTSTDPRKTLTYHANGGTNAPASQTIITPGYTTTLSTQIPVRENAEFLGWTTFKYITAIPVSPESGTLQPGKQATTGNTDASLYAAWRFINDEDLIISSDTIRDYWVNWNFAWKDGENVGVVTEPNEANLYDPAVVHSLLQFEADNYKYAIVEMMVESQQTDNTLTLFFAEPGEDLSAEKSVSVSHSGSTGGDYQALVIDLTQNEFWTGTVGTLRFDPFEGAPGEFEIKQVRFTGKDYAVTYDAADGNTTIPSQTKIHGMDLILSDTVPTRAGYTFTAWNTAADGTGIAYHPGDRYTANQAMTLYAQWQSQNITDYQATVTTVASGKTVCRGNTFAFTVSLSGTYDGYYFLIPKYPGITVTEIATSASAIHADDMGNGSWMISVIGGQEKVDSEASVIVTVTATVDTNAALGEMRLELVDVTLSSETGDEVTPVKKNYATIAITDRLPGDINNDGVFTYLDVSKLYAFFRKTTTLDDNAPVDVNGDGEFSYLDVAKLYAIFRKKATFN